MEVAPGTRRAAGARGNGRRFHRLGDPARGRDGPAPGRSSATWADFLRSRVGALLACDFFETVTLSGARLHVFAVIEHASRRIRMLGATIHPAASWAAQAARPARSGRRGATGIRSERRPSARPPTPAAGQRRLRRQPRDHRLDRRRRHPYRDRLAHLMPDAAGPRFRKNASPIRLRKDPAGVPRCPLTADVTGDDPRQCGPARAPCRPPEPPDPAGTLRTPWSWPGRTRAPAHSRWPAPPRDWRAALVPRRPRAGLCCRQIELTHSGFGLMVPMMAT